MLRRLYFLFPDKEHVQGAVDELIEKGIKWQSIHVYVEDEDIDISELPVASEMQKDDTCHKLSTILWLSNLVIFLVAVTLVFIDFIYGASFSTLISVALVVTTAYLAYRYSSLPDTHVSDFKDALAQGEILFTEIEHEIHQNHPEAVLGGVGWAIEPIHL